VRREKRCRGEGTQLVYVLLARIFCDQRRWPDLWEVMLYCQECESIDIPLKVHSRALFSLVSDANKEYIHRMQVTHFEHCKYYENFILNC
jgi:hypothetical protein